MAGASDFSVDLSVMRVPYNKKNSLLLEESLETKDPFALFNIWFEQACETPQIMEANAMHLATSTINGIPSVRTVLLKGFSTKGFKFFTNYDSRKGRELNENPHAALLFYWDFLKRCVRIEGTVERLTDAENEEYFHKRPKESQIGALCSNQSEPITGRRVISEREERYSVQYASPSSVVPKPAFWGGYIVKPKSFEFWQGQSDRLHDRIQFRRLSNNEKPDEITLHSATDGWAFERLSP